MGLIPQQAVVPLLVPWSKYEQIDELVRNVLSAYPDCQIISIDSVKESVGTWFFVTIETI